MGLASTMILARLLTPADFGLVAMAVVAVGLVDIFLDLGVGAALIQNNAAEQFDFDTAWTLRLYQTSAAVIIIILAAPLMASYYDDVRVTNIVRVVAISVFVGGLENIGLVLFQKNMEFGRELRFFVIKRAITTIPTLLLAFLLRSYWALIIGSLVGRIVGVILSYAMHSYRPRFSFTRVQHIWSFSQWNIVASIAAYLSLRTDQFVIGRRENASVLGAYAIGGEIAAMPSSELVAPLGRVMFPGFALVKDRPTELLRLVLLAFSVQALVGIPAGVGVALVAGQAVSVLLGDRWLPTVPFVQILGLSSVLWSMMNSSNYLLLALGKIRALTLYHAWNLVLLVSIIIVAFPTLIAQQIAIARLLVGSVALVVIQTIAARALPGLGLGVFLRSTWRPGLASLVMAVSALWLGQVISMQPAKLILLGKVVVGVLTYLLTLALLWRLTRSPEAGETYLLEKLGIRRRLGKGSDRKTWDLKSRSPL